MPDRAHPKRRHHHNVFISSTSKDLPDHRKAAFDAVWRCNMYPLAMESGTAWDGDAVKYSLSLAEEAEVYIGIFAFRYGYMPDDSDIAITEMEYRRAVERDIPILIFMMSDDHPVKPGDVETGPGAAKLVAFKKELKKKYVVGFFNSADKLGTLIIQALHEPELLKTLAPLSVAPESATLHQVRTIPAPPEPYIAHPYAILKEDFFGRAAEMDRLDIWASSENTSLVIEAIGGVGKSALTWQWLKTGRAAKAIPDLAGAMWFSFYESDATMGRFIREALAYVTNRPLSTLKNLSSIDVEIQFLAALKDRSYLLILDGIERILVAYHSMEVSQMANEPIEKKERREAEDVRYCTDPRHAAFLQKLIACAPSKILISTRLFPRDLADRYDAHRPLPYVGHLHLGGLHPDDAVALIRHRGVHGKTADLKHFMEQFGYHSLLIGAVAGRIANYPPAPGNFTKWYTDEGKNLHLSELDLKTKRTHILHYALDGLPSKQARLLCQIAAFRYPVEYAALSALNPHLPPRPNRVATTSENAYSAYQTALRVYETSPKMREARSRFHTDLSALEARGLLQWDRATNRYDLHPVVRGYALERLETADRAAAFERIRDYFDGLPPENLDTAEEESDLRRSLEIYNALLGAERLDDAARFYVDRLRDVLINHIAAYPLIIRLLTPLFPDGVYQLPSLTNPAQQNTITTNMANALYLIGQNDQAYILRDMTIRFNLEREYAPDLGISLSSYAGSLRSANHLAATRQTLELARELAEAARDTDRLALVQLYLLGSYRDTGHWAEVEKAYKHFGSCSG